MSYKDKEVQNAFQNTWLQRRRRAWMKGKRCIKCESLENLIIVQTGEGKHRPTEIWSRKLRERIDELSTCEVMCRKCHHDYINRKKGFGIYNRHGTRGRYMSGCRCPRCREVRVIEGAMRRGRKKDRECTSADTAKPFTEQKTLGTGMSLSVSKDRSQS